MQYLFIVLFFLISMPAFSGEVYYHFKPLKQADLSCKANSNCSYELWNHEGVKIIVEDDGGIYFKEFAPLSLLEDYYPTKQALHETWQKDGIGFWFECEGTCKLSKAGKPI